jgi:hypothetical protein
MPNGLKFLVNWCGKFWELYTLGIETILEKEAVGGLKIKQNWGLKNSICFLNSEDKTTPHCFRPK